jgi:NitT/TauT family transport system permease protein
MAKGLTTPATSDTTHQRLSGLAASGALHKLLRTLATIGVILAIWELVARLFFPPYILPPPTLVVAALGKIIADGTLPKHLQISLGRAVIGFLLAAVLAIPLGMLTAWWKVLDDTVGSALELLRPIPSLALIPLAIVWLGFGEVSKITLITYACFFSIYVNTHAGVRNVDPLYVKVMKIYGNGTRDILTKVVMYSMLPYVFTGLRYSAAVALILLVAVELVGAQAGLGFYLTQTQAFFLVPEMFATITVFGLLGFLANLLILYLERRVIKWRQAVGAEF